jgi:predicted helicase
MTRRKPGANTAAAGRADRRAEPNCPHFKPFSRRAGEGERPVTKDAIFHYVHAALHDPIYREKYAQNLKREFPRIPFHENFWRWADWGERLMLLPIGYETVEPWPLTRADIPDAKADVAGNLFPKNRIRAIVANEGADDARQ